MTRRSLLKWAVGGLALGLAACGHLDAPPPERGRACLVVRGFPERGELARYDLGQPPAFSLSFIHSVTLTPVRDDYQLRGSDIVQVAEECESHAAGLPARADEADARGWEFGRGKFLLKLERPIARLVVRTNAAYHNRLHLAGREINLNQWPDQALELKVASCRP